MHEKGKLKTAYRKMSVQYYLWKASWDQAHNMLKKRKNIENLFNTELKQKLLKLKSRMYEKEKS